MNMRGLVCAARHRRRTASAGERHASAKQTRSQRRWRPSWPARTRLPTAASRSRTLQTLANAFGGLLIGGGLGLLGGIVLGSARTFDRLMEFSIESLRPIPSVALIPIAMLVFGFGYRMEIAIVAFAAFWPVLILTRNAVAGVDRALYDVARVLQLDAFARTRKIVLPAALPRIVVAFRLAAGIALHRCGHGRSHHQSARSRLRRDARGDSRCIRIWMLAYLAWIGVVGWALNQTITSVQQRWFGRAAMVRAAP